MLVTSLSLRNFRGYDSATLELSDGINVLYGRNGAGKTNLLEAIYVGATGRSCVTRVESQMISFGEPAARVELTGLSGGREHTLGVGIERGGKKVCTVDGAVAERLDEVGVRPLVAVFMPDRLALIKGPPGGRRAHIDQLVAGLWPTRRATRAAYARALAQRNALLARSPAGDDQLDAWDSELATHGVALMNDRRAAVATVTDRFSRLSQMLGAAGDSTVRYKPNSDALDAEELMIDLRERRAVDRERGFTTGGPHRDDVRITAAGVDLRIYGSQGQQRTALLALVLAERESIAKTRDNAPITLLDDVMSELDRDRRERLLLEVATAGQCVVTTTELDHLPANRVTWRATRVIDHAVERSVEGGERTSDHVADTVEEE